MENLTVLIPVRTWSNIAIAYVNSIPKDINVIVVVNKKGRNNIENYEREGFKYIISDYNFSLGLYMNIGTDQCETEYIIFGNIYKRINPDLNYEELFNYIDENLDTDVFLCNTLVSDADMSLDDIIWGLLYDFKAYIYKKDLVDRMPYMFEAYFDNVLGYKFCVNVKDHGGKVRSIPFQLLADESFDVIPNDIMTNMNKVFHPKNDGDLTCVLSFFNEKEEVERTLFSLRYSADNVRILLVDDNSDDGFDYKSIAYKYGANYYVPCERLGSAGGKDIGGRLVESKYFCFFDAHMRVYKQNWDIDLIKELDAHPNCILAPRTIYMKKSDDNYLLNEDAIADNGKSGNSYCCWVTMEDSYEYDPKWTDFYLDDKPNHALTPVCCVLGAVYAMSKEWWLYIDGFKGLHKYGLEETFMSMKTWLLGGKCFCFKEWGVAHLYRKASIAGIRGHDVDANRFYLEWFFGESEQEQEEHHAKLRKRIGVESYNNAITIYNVQREHFRGTREKFLAKNPKPTSYFWEINQVFKEADEKIRNAKKGTASSTGSQKQVLKVTNISDGTTPTTVERNRVITNIDKQ